MREAPVRVARRKTCRRCPTEITWARTEAKGLSVPIVLDPYGDIVTTGETVRTPRGRVPVIRYVREGFGTHSAHVHVG